MPLYKLSPFPFTDMSGTNEYEQFDQSIPLTIHANTRMLKTNYDDKLEALGRLSRVVDG